MVPDHRVESVNGAVASQTDRATEGAPEQRCDNGVAGVLRHRLDDRSGNPGGVEAGRVPPAQVRQEFPSGRDVSGGQ
jgi:hypothetical protein